MVFITCEVIGYLDTLNVAEITHKMTKKIKAIVLEGRKIDGKSYTICR